MYFWPPPPAHLNPTAAPIDPKADHRRKLAEKLAELEERRSAKRPAREPGQWPDGVDASVRLTTEASAIAKRLRHTMSEWLPVDGAWKARCLKCSAGVTVSPRELRAAPIKGEAVTFHCTKPA